MVAIQEECVDVIDIVFRSAIVLTPLVNGRKTLVPSDHSVVLLASSIGGRPPLGYRPAQFAVLYERSVTGAEPRDTGAIDRFVSPVVNLKP